MDSVVGNRLPTAGPSVVASVRLDFELNSACDPLQSAEQGTASFWRVWRITSSGRWKETVLLWEYIGILPLECKRGLAQSSRYFCSHSKEVLKGNQRTAPQSWMLLRPLLNDCAVTVTDLCHAVHGLFE